MVQSDQALTDHPGFSYRTQLVMAAILAFAACGLLFQVPEPAIRVNHPFRAETLFALCLAGFVIARFRSRVALFAKHDGMTSMIVACIRAFAVWSTISAFWAPSIGSVAHHSLLWVLYLLVFLIFLGIVRRDEGDGFPVAIFCSICFILGLLCIFDYLTSPDLAVSEGPIRIRYGKYAEMLVTLLPLVTTSIFCAGQRGLKIVFAMAAGLGWLTVMLSLSKGAFIAGIIGFVIFFVGSLIFSDPNNRKPLAIAAVAWLALTIGTQVISSAISPLPSTAAYITGSADPSRDTSTMRLFTWGVGKRMASENLLLGVGADNFGLAFNKARAAYRIDHPDSPANEIGEDYLVERAHNEPLQVLAELGIIGLILFASPFLIFAWFLAKAFRGNGFRLSPAMWAAVAGMSAFAFSSLFSSFSFRAVQNGAVFFVVMAIAVREISTHTEEAAVREKRRFANFAYGLCILMTLALLGYCGTKIAAEYHAYQADRAENYRSADVHFRSAIAFDSGYAGAYLAHAAKAEQPSFAAELYRSAISNGIGTAPTYAALAKQQTLAGDLTGADASYQGSISIYPRSVFLLVSYAIFLEDQGRTADTAAQRKAAAAVDERQANGWYELIRNGSMVAFTRANADPSIAPPAELRPESAVRQFLDKFPVEP